MTSSRIPPPASSDPNEMLEMGSSKADLTSQNAARAATMPIIVLDSSSEGSTLGSEVDVSDTEDSLFDLITFTGEVGITSITGVDLKDNVGVTLDLDEIPEIVCGLALQVVVNATAKHRDFSWFSARDACIRTACQNQLRSKWHSTAQQLAACQMCSNTRNVCLGIDKDDQGKLILRIRPLASQFRHGTDLHDPEGWILPAEDGKKTLTSYRAWRQDAL
ncbi:hypothetical protein KC343_g736 [Hortaea werneckii]|nr:hypothetical protein KC317_g768 [Hortaea werneckii]KAI7637394.1 hypothetical protein KC343_g736 [Hortaea werneckii]KAI7683101.1 hypothetical protein KC319_g638 [Hortaea werneckii]